MQSARMESNWAAEHLQVIRTLMERAAVYRRALAPIMTLTGALGTIAALLGWWVNIRTPSAFAGYWMAVSLLALAGALLLVRRQALKDAEPFWSLSTRRVAQAFLPPLAAGLVLGLVVLMQCGEKNLAEQSIEHRDLAFRVGLSWLPLCWVILYGCSIHAAGFFMPRGMKLFGWIFIVGGCARFAFGLPAEPPSVLAHGIMGVFFGVLHLGYGIYLFFTEKNRATA